MRSKWRLAARFDSVRRSGPPLRRTRQLNSQQDEIMRYLRTGECDPVSDAWASESIITSAQRGNHTLRSALVAEVAKRTTGAKMPQKVVDIDVAKLAEEKVGPMVRGLFPLREQALLIDMFKRSVVFLTPDNIEPVILTTRFASTAWDLANLYLLSCGAELLAKEAPEIIGLSEDRTCYLSTEYFERGSRLDDILVHEAAHVFHNCKCETIGLTKTRKREWLLEIDYRKRELFAYACEAYSRIMTIGSTLATRKALLAELEADCAPPDKRVDVKEYLTTLREAVDARNGWKRILARCRPSA